MGVGQWVSGRWVTATVLPGRYYWLRQNTLRMRVSEWCRLSGLLSVVSCYDYRHYNNSRMSHISHSLPGQSSMFITRHFGPPTHLVPHHGKTQGYDGQIPTHGHQVENIYQQ